MDLDIIDTLSTTMPDANTNADADADVALGEPFQKGELCICVCDGMPDLCTVTVNMIIVMLQAGHKVV